MAKHILLAQDGRLRANVSIRRDATCVDEFAADELRRHLCQMVGAKTGRMLWAPADRSRIFVNNTASIAPESLPADGYQIETRDGDVHIIGNGRGVLYGVYDLLETLGCRWYAADAQVIPSLARIELPAIRKSASPAFEFRDHFSFEAWDPLFAARNRFNGNFAAPMEFMGGHNSYDLFVHTFYTLLPPNEFFDAHPEYFSLIDGVRRRHNAQLCLTNKDAVRIVAQRVLERMAKNPKARIFSVSQNDFKGYCTCPECSRVVEEEDSQAGPMIRFANAIAEETSKVYPDKLIDTLAYEYSLKAPRHVRPHPNVRVRLCSIRCCQGHGYGTCDHPGSVEFHEALQAWSKITSQMYIWHYCTNFAHYPLPMADLDEIHANINLYLKSGVKGLFMQGCGEEGGGAESAALRAHVIGRLLWNPKQPVWPIVDEFIAAYYGKAAAEVRGYLDLFHGRVRRNRKLHPSLYDSPHHPLFSDDVRRSAEKILRKGENKVTGTQQQRVRLLRHGIDYLNLYRAAGRFTLKNNVYRGSGKASDLKLAQECIRDWRAAGITNVQEGAAFGFSSERLRNRLKAHRVEWLSDGEHRIAVVPGLGGRLLQWHAFGHQWLTQPSAEGPWFQVYPLHDGYEESTYLAVYSRIGWAESYDVKRKGKSLTLVAQLDHHLRFERRYALSNSTLQITSRITNLGEHPRRAGWAGMLRLDLPGEATLELISSDGSQRVEWADLARPLVLENTRVPAGGWQLELPSHSVKYIARLAEPYRVSFSRDEKQMRLAYDIRTDERPLKPKESITAEQTIAISPR